MSVLFLAFNAGDFHGAVLWLSSLECFFGALDSAGGVISSWYLSCVRLSDWAESSFKHSLSKITEHFFNVSNEQQRVHVSQCCWRWGTGFAVLPNPLRLPVRRRMCAAHICTATEGWETVVDIKVKGESCLPGTAEVSGTLRSSLWVFDLAPPLPYTLYYCIELTLTCCHSSLHRTHSTCSVVM